jgi:hypothetical protein
MMKRLLGPALALCLVVIACGDDDTSSSGDAGAEYQSFAGDGFSLDLPTAWTVITPDDLDVEEIMATGLEELGLDGGSTADAIATRFASGVRVFAFDVAGSSPGFVDNFNLLQAPRPPFDPAELMELNTAEIEQAGWTILESELRSLPAGDGFFMHFEFTNGIAAQGALSHTLITDDAQWVLTFTASDPQRARAEFEHIAESFRVE